ncbi:MAG TPA: hypothetical protein VJQ44_10790 [Gemmatimonadales bacterium]|nr:hypothetical protein [Gemmatimonadales bacterium]
MIHTDWGWLALVGSAVLLPHRAGRLAGAGLGALVLALAALRVTYGASGLPADFAAGELALVLIGMTALVGGMVRGARGRRGVLAATLAAAGLVLVRGRIGTILHAAPLGTSAAAFGIVGGLAVLAAAATHWVLARLRMPASTSGGVADRRSIGVAAAGVLVAATGSHVFLVGFGALVASAAAWATPTRPRALSAGVPLVLCVVVLIPAAWLLLAIAGEQGLALNTVSDLPLSPAAETLLAPLLLLAAWSVAGLWPLSRVNMAGITGAAGLLLMARVAAPALPEGLDHWRPLAFPLLGVGIWQGIASGRLTAIMVGGALMALCAGSAEAPAAAWCLGGAALAADLVAPLWPGAAGWVRRAALLAAGYGVWPATAAGLRAEVVYTAMVVAGAAVLLVAGSRVDPSHGQIDISRFDR